MGRDLTVYYAIDDKPLYVFMAARSIASLRRHDPHVRVRLFVCGVLDHVDAARFRESDVEVTPCSRSVQPYGLKWQALQHIDTERAVFVDADTIFHDRPTRLLERADRPDFAARLEGGMAAPHFDEALFAAHARALGAVVLPVFNTGVMVFDHGIHEAIAGGLEELELLMRSFTEGRLRYPCANVHVVEEVAASLVLGAIEGITFEALSPTLLPFFADPLRVPGGGVVLHVFTARYRDHLLADGTADELRSFDAALRETAARLAASGGDHE